MTEIKDDYYNVGIKDKQERKRRDEHGENILTPPARTPMWKLFLEKFLGITVTFRLILAAASTCYTAFSGDLPLSSGSKICIPSCTM